MLGRDDQLGLSWEALGGVTGEEPRARQAVLVEQLQQARHPDLGGKHAARDVAGRILASVRTEPTRDRVAVDTEGTEDLLLHDAPSVLFDWFDDRLSSDDLLLTQDGATRTVR